MAGEKPAHLTIEKTEYGFQLLLDGIPLNFVEDYEIKSTKSSSEAELNLKILVSYP